MSSEPRLNPRVVIGAPLFNKAEYLGLAVESLLAQTYRDFALLLIDDRSTDETAAIAREFAERDRRVVFVQNEERLGMLHNTRKAFLLARELFPGAPYWALGSDHDVWEPRWLETLVAELDAHPDAVLAYPHSRRIGADGEVLRGPWDSFDTRDITSPRERFRQAFRRMVAGDMIYGLFRAEAFARVGPYRPVLVPDRLLLTELAWHGSFRQVPALLWSRRFRGLADLDRQRRAFFLDGTPPTARLPWWVAHTLTMLAAYVLRGEGRPEISRALGARLTLDYLAGALRLRARRRSIRAVRALRRWRGRLLGHLLGRAVRVPVLRRRVLPSAARLFRRAADRLGEPATGGSAPPSGFR